ncbi:DUF5953 family protein [Archangium lansingense]|uniref:DUF5953 family protein n=1 Tax=Archangium lansingense TaxID=2995310 RepID=UPI00280A856B|nr:DUF5953 family protein [Archangium lansinium]
MDPPTTFCRRALNPIPRRGTPRSSCSEERRTACRCRTEVARLGLTGTPLDLDNPAHLDPLKRAYERFPEIGGRAAP